MNTNPDKHILEVCAADTRSVMAAHHSGADRIELCAALSEGGLTPSAGMVKAALGLTNIPIRVMIRPRSGDFSYTHTEIEQMEYDIKLFSRLGVDGFVVGALDNMGRVDVGAITRLVGSIEDKPWTFHRAFDFCPDPYQALETIVALGADTLLTSGQATTAIEGAELLKNLVKQSAGRITVMAGAGVSPENIARLLVATGCKAFHLSARSTVQNQIPLDHATRINATTTTPDHLCRIADQEIIKRARKELDAHLPGNMKT
jgi:copper homeostasis protein